MWRTAGLLWNFLREVGKTVRRTHSKSAVEHTGQKNEAIARISGAIEPICPNKVTGSMTLTVIGWHDGTNHDGDENSAQHEEAADSVNASKNAVATKHNGAADHCDDLVDNKDLPALDFQVRVVKRVAEQDAVADDCGICRRAKDPGQQIPPASEPAADSAISRSGSNCRPVIDCIC